MTNYDGQRVCGFDDTQALTGMVCKWPAPGITWTIVADLPGFARESFRQAMELAWSYWSAVCGIQPKYVEGTSANVLMGIQTIGPGGVLADSEMPCGVNMGSRLKQRYDTAEDWVIAENPPPDRIDLVRTGCHEQGHVIGLAHDEGPEPALLAPYYSRAIRKPLAPDIRRAQRLYGPPVSIPKPPPPGDYTEICTLLADVGGRIFVKKSGVIRPFTDLVTSLQ